MSELKHQGLQRLKGLGELSKEQYDNFINNNKELISKHGYDPAYINNLYANKQFIDRYGVETFKAMPNIDMRKNMFKEDVVNEEFDKWARPTGTNKGLGSDYAKYRGMSADAKLKLMESDYLTPTEFEAKWKKDQENGDKADFEIFGIPIHLPQLNAGILPIQQDKLTGKGGEDALNAVAGREAKKQYMSDKNRKILENIYNDDADNMASKLGQPVSEAYYAPDIMNLSDSQVKKAFAREITPGSYKDKNGIPNLGIPEYASHFGNGSEGQVSSEMEDFSIDEMRQVLAKKKVYDAYLSPEMAMTALNNEAKRYIKEHQGSLKRFGLFAKDVGISAMSYTADKMNGIAELGRMAQDKLMEKPVVLVDDRGNVLDPKKTKTVRDRQGHLYWQDKDGNLHSAHQEQIDYTTLHNMGKNTDGSDIEGAFGVDWLTLNPQYWTRAEQFGTLDENEQKQYEKLGSSPYKVAYNPNEEGDLMYEAFKMMSFGIADAGSMLVPYGVGALGRTLSTASKVGKIARGFGKMLDTTGKLLTAETRVGQMAQGTAGALGIAYAYNRGAFQETLAQNLANAEEAVQEASKRDIYNQYQRDKDYRAYVDKQINARAASKKVDYLMQIQREGGARITDEGMLDNMLHARAQEEVLGELVQGRIKERMASKEYADLQQEAINSAGDAAFNTFLPEAIKYGFVNNFGFRKFLYTNPAGLQRKVSSTLKGLKEITTDGGLKRMATEGSKFLTAKDKWKEFGKTLGSQAWGGAWTNGTDDMQVDAAERMNNDSYSRYLRAYQNGEALTDVYGFADGLYSYLKGLSNSAGQETTWNAALVGGLGSVVNFTPNFANIARLATKEGREAYKNNFRKEIERGENGIPLKNEDGTIKYKDLGKWNNWREQANYFIQNGVLNTYYGKKQSERDLQSHADYVNNILDRYDDFKDIEKIVAADIASENLLGEGDRKTLQFANALHAAAVLENLGNDSKDPTTMSSVVQDVKTLMDKASQLDLSNGENPFSEGETKSLLSQYYVQNPDVEQSEENDRKALAVVARNAQKLREATEAFNKAEKEIQKIERNQGIEIDPEVRTSLKVQQALYGHWQERKEKMQEEIEDPSTEERPQDARTVIAAIGGKKNAQSLIKTYDRQEAELQKELEEQRKVSNSLYIDMRAAQEELKKAESNEDSEEILRARKKVEAKTAAWQDSKEQEAYWEDLTGRTREKKEHISKSLEEMEESKEAEKILTADEIFSLDPVTRAQMMAKENRDLYEGNKKQQAEIEKLEKDLLVKDADALQKIQDIALLTQRIGTAKDAYNRMARNPKAAANAFERQRALAASAAYGLMNQKNAETLARFINQYDDGLKNHPGTTEKDREEFAYQQLRKINSDILDILDQNNMLPQFKTQIAEAREWGKTVEDISSIIDGAEKDDAWKENTRKNIDSIVEKSHSKEDIMANLEKVIGDVDNPDAASDFEYILEGMSNLGYQRSTTVIEDRKQKQQREEAERARKEAEKKKIEEEAKAAAERQKEEEEKKKAEEEKRIEEERRIAEGTNPDNIATEGEITFEDDGTASVEDSNFTEGNKENTMEKKNEQKEEAAIKPKEEDSAKEETTVSGETIPKGEAAEENTAGEKSSQEGKESSGKENTSEEENTSERNGSDEADAGVDGKHFDEEGNFIGESDNIDEQMKEGVPTDREVHVSDSNEDVAAANGTGEYSINTDANTLTGNSMSRYKGRPLKENGIIEKKVGERPDDRMNKYYAWMDAAGVKLQNIIDHELSRIIKNNPTAKVRFMAVKPEKNATNDYYMQTHLMLVLDYDDSMNKGITKIHDEKNGGVIESMGKKYLIIGTAGYGDMNASKLELYKQLWNPKTLGGTNLQSLRKQFFDKHPTERFYVNERYSTEVVPSSLIPGYIVRQTEEDTAPRYRSVRELLADKSRNPYNIELSKAAWGIQEFSRFLVVGTSLDNVMVPRNKMRNMGSAFVLMPASNGKLVPSYLKVLKYTEMNEGKLKDRIDGLLQNVTSPSYDTRLRGIIELMKILYFHKDGDYILAKKNKAEISLVHDGKVFRTFVLDSSFDRMEFKKAFEDMNPRINITARVLGNEELLKEYDEAGALMTDTAMFGTAGSSYAVWGIDGDGEMTKPRTVGNEVPKPNGNSDYRKKQSQVIFQRKYYREEDGVFSLNGETVTDENILKQLRYNKMITDNGLMPATSIGVWEYYILSEGEHPQVIRVNRNTKETREATEKQAEEIIDRVNKEKEKKQKEENAKKALGEAAKQEGQNMKGVDLEDSGITVDEETGEMIEQETQETRESETSEEESKEKESEKEEERPSEKETPVSERPLEEKGDKATQKFENLYSNRGYKMRLMKLFRMKWKDAPTDLKGLEKFLREKNVEVDSIGTSEEDIEAWIKTIEECR